MEPQEALVALAAVRDGMREAYPDHPDRLAQLDGALATAAMVVEHIADEEIRHKHDAGAHARATGAW